MPNNGKNLDLMLSVRHEPKKDEITGQANIELTKLLDRLDYEEIEEKEENKLVDIKELIQVYKWDYHLKFIASFSPIFSDIIVQIKNQRFVRICDFQKFDERMYLIMGE